MILREKGCMNNATWGVGIVGTGYVAQKRLDCLQNESRCQVKGVSGNTPYRLQEFGQRNNIPSFDHWEELVGHPDIDLVFVCTINRDHGKIVRSTLLNQKHVVVEYPLSLNLQDAQEMLSIAQKTGKLLHIEHIECLGGLHQAIRQNLPTIGDVYFARYITIAPKKEVHPCWNYNHQLFGFPLAGALSRLHRLLDLWGTVDRVNGFQRYWHEDHQGYYQACLCQGQLYFSNGILGEVTYGKGTVFTQPQRTFEIQGTHGILQFTETQGKLIQGNTITPLEFPTRKGLFLKDTQQVFDFLEKETPLYIQPSESVYSLQIATAIQNSAITAKACENHS